MKIVQKYGGSSLADVRCVHRVAERIRADAENNQMLVVVSAQGKTTDRLTVQYKQYSDCFPSRESDALLCTGEQVSASLLTATLNSMGVKAVSLTGAQVPIYVSGPFGDGEISRIETTRIKREWDCGNIVIVTGFQGISEDGDYITLGRGGSDTSAVALAAAVKADKCMIFTDVDGIYSADPNRIPDAVRFDKINQDTVIALAENGAKVLHPKAARLVKESGIPTEILTSFSVRKGTLISPQAPKQVGITSCDLEDGLSCITVVFSDPPTMTIVEEIQSLPEICSLINRGEIIQIMLPKYFCDGVMKKIHRILYPK